VALAAAGAVVALLPGADEKPTRSAAATTTTPRAQRTATTPAPAPTPAPSADTRSPSELNDAGFSLMQQGRYAEAVPLLQRAVEGFREQGDTASLAYAYSLFNLASALARTGDESAAVPLLQERLRVSNDQRGVVLRELRKVLGGSSAAARPQG
jgi:tetratricopeptide (TPR) repeat protein